MAQIDKCIDYVAAHPEVRDVLLSGGDCLMVSDENLEYIIKRLRAIPHGESVRLGSRRGGGGGGGRSRAQGVPPAYHPRAVRHAA